MVVIDGVDKPVFISVSKSNWFCNTTLHDWLFFIQSEVELKPVATRLHSFSRASRQLHLFRVLIGPGNGLSTSPLIGQSDNFCFGFTTHTI